ncbi:hypothetical protein GWI33_006369 [Rhynchophorus ferrugineus]|uniref:Uncharacterized protein n=1 Tax=Rhynchophorus ferrugineus TaxID=354439 RepID=A0A834IEE5_RHYFE|nr:hypothetical protein GWI33_006369 [Rhynchophorus ferrugineus]
MATLGQSVWVLIGATRTKPSAKPCGPETARHQRSPAVASVSSSRSVKFGRASRQHEASERRHRNDGGGIRGLRALFTDLLTLLP